MAHWELYSSSSPAESLSTQPCLNAADSADALHADPPKTDPKLQLQCEVEYAKLRKVSEQLQATIKGMLHHCQSYSCTLQ
jgi:hypothetical protein